MDGRGDFSRVRGYGTCGNIETQGELIPGHRLKVHEYVIFGAFPGRLYRELRIASWVEAGVAPHTFFEALPVPSRNVRSVVQRSKTWVTVLQVNGFDEAVKPKPVHWVFTGEQRPQSV